MSEAGRRWHTISKKTNTGMQPTARAPPRNKANEQRLSETHRGDRARSKERQSRDRNSATNERRDWNSRKRSVGIRRQTSHPTPLSGRNLGRATNNGCCKSRAQRRRKKNASDA